MTQRHIITVSLESIKTKRQLKALFHDERLHVENTETREGFETYRIPINKRLFVLEDVDAATDMVLDRAFQKQKTKAVAAPQPPAPKARSRRDSAREPWEAQYDQVDEAEPTVAETEEEEEMNLATLLNVIDGQVFTISTCIHLQSSVHSGSTMYTFNFIKRFLAERRNVENPGRIMIMTSNYPERLDKALVRKGRVDLFLEFKKASSAIIKEM